MQWLVYMPSVCLHWVQFLAPHSPTQESLVAALEAPSTVMVALVIPSTVGLAEAISHPCGALDHWPSWVGIIDWCPPRLSEFHLEGLPSNINIICCQRNYSQNKISLCCFKALKELEIVLLPCITNWFSLIHHSFEETLNKKHRDMVM